MNKHLYNFLDKCEGLPKGTTVKNITKEIKLQKNHSIKKPKTDYGPIIINALKRQK